MQSQSHWAPSPSASPSPSTAAAALQAQAATSNGGVSSPSTVAGGSFYSKSQELLARAAANPLESIEHFKVRSTLESSHQKEDERSTLQYSNLPMMRNMPTPPPNPRNSPTLGYPPSGFSPFLKGCNRMTDPNPPAHVPVVAVPIAVSRSAESAFTRPSSLSGSYSKLSDVSPVKEHGSSKHHKRGSEKAKKGAKSENFGFGDEQPVLRGGAKKKWSKTRKGNFSDGDGSSKNATLQNTNGTQDMGASEFGKHRMVGIRRNRRSAQDPDRTPFEKAASLSREERSRTAASPTAVSPPSSNFPASDKPALQAASGFRVGTNPSASASVEHTSATVDIASPLQFIRNRAATERRFLSTAASASLQITELPREASREESKLSQQYFVRGASGSPGIAKHLEGGPPRYIRNRRAAVSSESITKERIANWRPPVYPKTEREVARLAAVIRGKSKLHLLFGHLAGADEQAVINAMFRKEVPKQTDLIRQGDEGDNFYIVDSGHFEIFVSRLGQPPQKVMDAPPGESFGELALMYNAPRAATCTALVDSVVWALDRATFQMMLVTKENSRKKRYEELLEAIEIFRGLTKYEKCQLSDILQMQICKDGECIIQQGDIGDRFFIVENGECVCKMKQEGHPEIEVQRYRRGGYFGELALIVSYGVRQASVYATGDKTSLLWIDKSTFDRVLGPIIEILKKNAGSYPTYHQLLNHYQTTRRMHSGHHHNNNAHRNASPSPSKKSSERK